MGAAGGSDLVIVKRAYRSLVPTPQPESAVLPRECLPELMKPSENPNRSGAPPRTRSQRGSRAAGAAGERRNPSMTN